jgi:hypothetical protein
VELFRPLARSSELLTEEVDGELLIYDEERDTATRLNRTAAVVWRSCDGQRSIGTWWACSRMRWVRLLMRIWCWCRLTISLSMG